MQSPLSLFQHQKPSLRWYDVNARKIAPLKDVLANYKHYFAQSYVAVAQTARMMKTLKTLHFSATVIMTVKTMTTYRLFNI